MKKTVLRLQVCEDRLAPSAAIDSGYETYSWVFVNTMRANPTAFANNLQGLVSGTVSRAFGFSKSDPVIADLKRLVSSATHPANYGASLSLMRVTPAAGPLAWDETLEGRAGAHNDWMRANGFAHTGTTGARNTIPGYTKSVSAPADTWGYGPPTYTSMSENIAWAVGSARSTKAAYNAGSMTYAGLQQREAFLDTAAYLLELNSPSLGHLKNLLGRDNGFGGTLPAFNVIGTDTDLFQAPAGYEVQDGVPEAWLSTHRLALTRPNGSGGFVAGVAYQDNNGNGFYDAGEGVGVTVNIRDASGNGRTVNTDAQGAFSEYVSNGTYTVTFSSDGQFLGSRTVGISNTNAWADLAIGRPSAAPGPDLGQPTITGPGGTLAYLRPTVTWTGVEGASAFQVRVNDLTTGATNLFPGATVSKQDWTVTADLVSGHAYRAWVRAVRGDEAGPWSGPNDFTIARPVQTGPANGVTHVRPTFTWSAIGWASGYEVRLNDATAGIAGLYRVRVGGTDWTPAADLVPGRTYTWQVRALNAGGQGGWSPAAAVTLGRPTLLGPFGDTTNHRPTLTWTGIGAAPAYQVRVDDLTTGRARLFFATTGSLDWTPPTDLTVGHTYRWFARALNTSGLGKWSPAATFRVV